MFAHGRVVIKAYVNLFMLSGVIFLFSHSVDAQQPPYQFGDIPDHHLQMNEFPADPNASAVILFDYGEVHTERYRYVIYRRHVRIKILSTAGFDWGTHSMRYYSRRGFQKISKIQGITVNQQSDGTRQVHHLDPGDIFDESISENYSRVRFTMPALKPGSVIEYTYEIISGNPTLLPNWEFQTTEPVLWSEYNVSVSANLEYVFLIHGYHDVYISEYWDGADRGLSAERGRNFRWVMKDLPAIREEPYITTLDDYIAKITFQLASVYSPGRYSSRMFHDERRYIMSTWEDIVKGLMSSREFGRLLPPHRSIRRLAASLVEDISDPRQRLETIYEYVRTTMVWDGRYRVFPSDRLDRVHDRKSGSGADIALLLVGMLREAGIDAHPLILSTRDNGKIQNIYPMVAQFNHVIAFANIDEYVYLLDATDPLCPVNVLPYNTLNETGLLINDGIVTWISLNTPAKYSKSIIGDIDLASDGTFFTTMNIHYDGYGAVTARRKLSTRGGNEFISTLLGSEAAVIAVDSLALRGKEDTTVPLEIYLESSSDEYVLMAGDVMYFNPMIFGRTRENPFKLQDRTFPVDFAYPRERSVVKHISVPEGYEVVKLPRSVNLRLPNESARFFRDITVVDGIVTLQQSFEINKANFSPDEYHRLRTLFERVVALESEPIVLERTKHNTGGDTDHIDEDN